MSDIQPTEQDHHEEQTALELALRNCMTWLSANVTTVIYGLAAILAIAAVVVFMQRKPAGNPEASRLLLTASTPEQFQDIADSSPTSLLGMWSRLRQGDRHLNNAVPNMFVDREKAVEDIKSAKSAYDNLGSQSGLTKELRERVYIGLARIAECECDGTKESVEAAKTAWEQVLAVDSESLVKDHAQTRIARLEKAETADFYKWFAALNPKPLLPGSGGAVPEIPDGLLPNDFPGAAASEEATSETPEEPEKGNESADGDADKDAEAEAPGAESPTTEKPEADKPEADKPAADKPTADKPTADKPTADKPAATKEEATEAAKATTEAADAKPDTAKTDGDN